MIKLVKHKRFLSLGFVATALASTLCFAETPATRPTELSSPLRGAPAIGAVQNDAIDFQKDIVYGKTGGEELKLNLARPKVIEQPAPCVLVIHGGGWSGGNKDQHNDVIKAAAARGYVSVSVDYRLAPKYKFPAPVEDVKCAVRFLRANAEKYNIDPKRMGAVGFSAGAHLAMMLGVMDKADGLEGDGGWPEQSSKVQAVVSFFGPTDLSAPEIFPDISPILKSFMGGYRGDMPERYKQASPITYVKQDSAPMLLLQGTNDPLVNWKQAVRMAEALTKNEVDGRVELLLGQGHGWRDPELTRSSEVTFAFFNEKLKK